MSEHDDDLEVATTIPESDAAQIADAIAQGLLRIAGALERGLHEIAVVLATAPAPRGGPSRSAAGPKRARRTRR